MHQHIPIAFSCLSRLEQFLLGCELRKILFKEPYARNHQEESDIKRVDSRQPLILKDNDDWHGVTSQDDETVFSEELKYGCIFEVKPSRIS